MLSARDLGHLCLGGNVFGWTADEATSFAVLDAFAAGGGRLIDTADMYSEWAPGNSGGESERIIGRWLATHRSGVDVLVATKVGKLSTLTGLRPDTIATAARASLSRLGTSAIDLYYAHADDPEVPLAEMVGAFGRLLEEGLIRSWGLSNFSAARVLAVVTMADRQGVVRPIAVQPHYSLVHRQEVETEGLAEACLDKGLGLLPYYSLASGFLTGKYSRTSTPASLRNQGARQFCTEAGYAVVDVLTALAERHDAAVASVALAWLRRQPGVIAPIASARTVEQVAPLLRSTTLELTDAELVALDEVSRPWLW